MTRTVETPAPPPPTRPRPRWQVGLAVVVAALGAAGLAIGIGGVLAEVGAGGRSAAVLVAAVLVRSVADAAGVVCVGLALVPVLLGRANADARPVRRADRLLVLAAGGWLMAQVIGIALRTADSLGRSVGALTVGDLVAWTTRLIAGRGMLVAAGCAAVLLVLAVLRVRRPGALPALVALGVAVVGAVVAPVTGHAGAVSDQWQAVPSTILHAGAAALWVGGLGALLVLVAPDGDLLEQALPRYSRLAGDCLLILVISGVFTTVIRLNTWTELFTTGYGLLVVVKTVLLLALAGLGGLARRRLHTGRRPVLRWAGVEVLVMAVTIGVAATLSQTPPPGSSVQDHNHTAAPAVTEVPTGPVDVIVSTAQDAPGVVDDSGRPLYRSDADSAAPSNSTCITPQCLAVWEPVLTEQRPAAGPGVAADVIGTVVRPDGSRQVTLAGWPLYRRVDGTPADGADGVWFAITPQGGKATR